MDFEKIIKQSPLYAGEVSNASILNMLGNKPKRGEIIYCEKENEYYIFNDKWEPYKGTSGKIELSVYDLNKQIIEQLGPIPRERMKQDVYSIINDFYNTKKDKNFFMLLGKEISYYTIFHKIFKDAEYINLAEGVMECLENVGKIYSVEITEDQQAVEIWIKESGYIGMTVLYLFPYDEGICTIGG